MHHIVNICVPEIKVLLFFYVFFLSVMCDIRTNRHTYTQTHTHFICHMHYFNFTSFSCVCVCKCVSCQKINWFYLISLFSLHFWAIQHGQMCNRLSHCSFLCDFCIYVGESLKDYLQIKMYLGRLPSKGCPITVKNMFFRCFSVDSTWDWRHQSRVFTWFSPFGGI